jgi:hypothetical protein
MKVTRHDETILELEGVPQGRGLWFAAFVSAGLSIGAGMFTLYIYMTSNSWTSAIMPGIGTAFGLFLFCFVFAMSLRRERLTIDKVTRTATHATWSLLAGSRREVGYPFDKIQAASVERSMQSSGGRKGFSAKVTRARLLITKPRRAILMDESQGGGKKTIEELEALARLVAEFVGVEVREMGKHEE